MYSEVGQVCLSAEVVWMSDSSEPVHITNQCTISSVTRMKKWRVDWIQFLLHFLNTLRSSCLLAGSVVRSKVEGLGGLGMMAEHECCPHKAEAKSTGLVVKFKMGKQVILRLRSERIS